MHVVVEYTSGLEDLMHMVAVFEADTVFLNEDRKTISIWVGQDNWIFSLDEKEFARIKELVMSGKSVVVIRNAVYQYEDL